MTGPVSYARDGDVAIITVDNPPVNALGTAVRIGLVAAMDRFDADEDAKAAVITGAGRTFPAGADISEFGKPPNDPWLPAVCTRIEAATKPVIATLHGTALGGGLEIALGAHWRVAQKTAKVGLPEVHLGIIPGAGGTQRAPRLIGFDAAVEMIATGRHIKAPEALSLGLIDRIDEGGDPLAAGLTLARELIAQGAGPRRTGDIALDPPAPGFFDDARAALAKKAKGQTNLVECVAAIEGALTPIEKGMAHEREVYRRCHDGPQRAALVHAFFSERAVARVPEAKAAPRPVEVVGIVGGGTMGAGIAAAALNAGLTVVMAEQDVEAAARGEANLRRNYASSVKKGRMSQEALDAMLAAKFSAAGDLAALARADLIIEAAFEKMEVKKEIFARLDRIAKPGAVLATNTSYLDVDEIAAVTGRPEDVLGLHFFSPAHIMRLLEVVVGAKTAPEVAATGFALGKRMKKVAVRAGVCDGFIGNRILGAYLHAAHMMVEDGADPYAVDAAVKGFGYPMGPFAMGDLAGLDIGYFNRRAKDATRDPSRRYAAGFLDRMVEAGWLGQKAGRGFYVYEDGARSGPPNPEVPPLIEAERARLGITPREIGTDEILRRYVAAMTNEAAKLLGEGIALRPLDIDMVSLFGYGYPRWRGGVMHHADAVGLPQILSDIRAFAPEDPDFWTPAPLLAELAEKGGAFADLNHD